MSTYKRRIVYFTDEQWEVLAVHAKKDKTTISQLIRDHLDNVWPLAPEAAAQAFGGVPFDRATLVKQPVTPGSSKAWTIEHVRQSAQAQRDAILRNLNRKG